MDQPTLRHLLALSFVPNVGPILTKNLIAYCGSPEGVFQEKSTALTKIPGVGKQIARNIIEFNNYERVESELQFIEKHNIQPLYYLNRDFPERLKEIEDSPVLLFYKGNGTLNTSRIVGIVGTRKASNYGRDQCYALVEGLKNYGASIASGLAYGIDYHAHQAAEKFGNPNFGVLGHGLDTIYPPQHLKLASKMLNNGGLITEYLSGTQPDRENFPQRNRIVAGLIDGLIIVETDLNGGALITGDLAFSYNREVFAIPGRTNDQRSSGCNHILKTNKAYLVENADDVAYHMGWEKTLEEQQLNESNEVVVTDEEQMVLDAMQNGDQFHIDVLSYQLEWPTSRLSMLLFNLELKGLIRALPGNQYSKMG